ncbi:hypothetical protein SAMN05444483_101594 [Salegentibacter echinorum]|uniref:Lipocalin-like domain-containing protein n=1 Tax=Salegentibacter echinorum TaxID=1073325 RepID=A0A1M5CN22_SALEC|nr:hypothetical protein [Salegentibacter echinorum]SHF56066.1 hypothetical protein SAMN05444483_101594 [Salegentibacter echinorum]
MKKLGLLFLLSFIVLSCSSDDENEPQEKDMNLDLVLKELPQEWKLVKMTGSFSGSETTGDDMGWQESYIFKSDSTFTKTRLRNGKKLTATGTFVIGTEYKNTTAQKSLKLTFDKESSIIGSCSNEPLEYLYYKNDENLLLSNWWACDGPGLFYKKVE